MAPIYQPPVPFSPNVNTSPYPPGGPFAGFQCKDVSLTSAQILALDGTAVPLIAAPGAGLMLVPSLIIIRVAGLTAAYTDAGGAVQFAIGSMVFALAANTVFTGPTDGEQSQQIVAYAGISTHANPSTNVNAALNIQKITNNFAAGSGTAHITIYYTTEKAA